MNITFADVLKVVNRFRNEETVSSGLRSADFATIVKKLKQTFNKAGAKAAMRQARQIAAAFNNLRAHRVAERTDALRSQAERQGLRYV